MTDRDAAFNVWKERALEVDILEAAIERGAVLKRVGKYFIGPCPACGGKDRFSVNQAKRLFNCRGSGGGDVIRLVEHVDGVSFLQAVEALTGEPPPRGKSKPLSQSELEEKRRRGRIAQTQNLRLDHEREEYERNTRAAAWRIWGQSKPIAFTPAETYLISRGLGPLDCPWPECFRFHPALPYPKLGNMPALVCRVDDVGGELSAIWRIFLTADGSGKAPVDNPKLGLGPASGGAVRIGSPNSGAIPPKLGLAEGIESALGGWLLTRRRFPVWAALSTSGLTGIELPIGVEHVCIFPDGDIPIKRDGTSGEYIPSGQPPGRKAARKLKERLDKEGIACVIAAEPSVGQDYADLWLAQQRDVA